jgi:glutathione S-transferase
VFSLTTMRSFCPVDLGPYAQIRAYLQDRIGVRDAYRRAMQKCDPDIVPMLS